MDDRLLAEILERLDDARFDDPVEGYVLAACLDELDEVAKGGVVQRPQVPPEALFKPVGAYLQRISVQGFRGIGERRALQLEPGPGLTLVVGRNGTGKSSFAEGVELVLTGHNRRWADRSKVWQEAWRNLHAPDAVHLQLELVEEGRSQPTLLTRSWPPDAELDGAATAVRRAGMTDEPFSALGWDDALVRYRPILSYNELAAILDGKPTELYDEVAALLGVDAARDAAKALGVRRRDDEQPLKTVKQARAALLDHLAESDDERASTVLAALAGKTWDLDDAEALLLDDDTASSSKLQTLRGLASLAAPDAAAAAEAAARVEEAAGRRAATASTDAGRASRLATLLEAAARCVAHDGDQPCPVCGSGVVLDARWQAEAQQQIASLRTEAAEATAAESAWRSAVDAARRLCSEPPALLSDAAKVGIDTGELATAWRRWAIMPEDPAELARHLREQPPLVAAAAAAVRAAASAKLDRRQAQWRPLAVRVAAWISDARAALTAHERSRQLKKAEDWLAGCVRSIAAQRFAPIEKQMFALWEQLRLDSSVQLDEVALRSSGTRRHLALDVSVDDSDASALGVMSQGELHALALSVFLPRATLDASPFRFVVIDDPVQSMDPARVDGLARVLAGVAADRQVVVFTHDARLPEAVRRLELPARILAVTRRPGSRVEVREESDPVARALTDAQAVALTDDLDAGLRERLVPALCRDAIEAACSSVIRRRRLRRGERHDDVQLVLEAAQTTNDLAALALHDDAGAGSRVLPKLNEWGRDLADVYQWCRKGAHAPPAGLTMIEGVDRAAVLARKIAALP